MKRKTPFAVLLAALLVVVLAAPATAPAATKKDDEDQVVTVMARNMFLGVDIRRAAGPKTIEELTVLIKQLIAEEQATDVPNRIKLMAAEIKKADPDLVGLQELTYWQLGPTVIDYGDMLSKAIDDAGLDYRLIRSKTREADVSVQTPEGLGRFSIENAILVKKGVKTSGLKQAPFKTNITFPNATGNTPVNRGWMSLNATIGKAKFRFVNTHLEAFSADQRTAQAKELVAGPLKSSGQVILVGDLNSNKNEKKPEDRPAFQAIEGAGFRVTQTKKQTCCLNDDLKTGVRDHTVDFVMTKPKLKLLKSDLLGVGPKTPAGTEAADHAGVFSSLLFPVD